MNTDIINDKLTIKDIIFTKALPNYQIPVSTDGYKIFPCIDCGDKFLFESSFEYHINRKSLKISYFCRHCMKVTIFYNRCKLLSHIRSHAFKSATITVTDIKIEPVPLANFNLSILQKSQNLPQNYTHQQKSNVCYECNENINKYRVTYMQHRAAHYMQHTEEAHSCPICTFSLPTVCALEAHLRIHLNIPPYFCPECGMHLPNRVASYPFDHNCEGFKLMKAATRLTCKINNCNEIFRPDEYRTHFRGHLIKINRCSFCLEMWYNEPSTKCSLCKNGNISSYIQCPRCPNKLFSESLLEKHLNSHCMNLRDKLNDQSYTCTICNTVYQQMYSLINHHVNKHSSTTLKAFLSKFLIKSSGNKIAKGRKYVYHRVVKKCSNCLRQFTYRCLYENIRKLPNDCPYNCSNTEIQNDSQSTEENHDSQIVCFLCKTKINQNWNTIKLHYAEFHKNHKCLDIQILVKKLDKKLLKKYNRRNLKSTMNRIKSKKKMVHMKKLAFNTNNTNKDESKDKSREPNVCIICNYNCENVQNLEIHMITHRDPCMAYQCLECGKCFVVKPSFSTHLLLEHGISNVQEYINKKPCYNESALLKNQNFLNPPIDEPVTENQCKICRDQFDNPNDLEKHFRVHGMAFLIKNSHKNSASSDMIV